MMKAFIFLCALTIPVTSFAKDKDKKDTEEEEYQELLEQSPFNKMPQADCTGGRRYFGASTHCLQKDLSRLKSLASLRSRICSHPL